MPVVSTRTSIVVFELSFSVEVVVSRLVAISKPMTIAMAMAMALGIALKGEDEKER